MPRWIAFYEFVADFNDAERFLEETRFRMSQGEIFEKEWVTEQVLSLIKIRFQEK